MIIFGTRMFGKVDQAPGLFYVATRFFHIWFVPLIPIGSFLVLDAPSDGDSFRGVQISMSFKSVLTAWFRAGSFLGGAAALVFGVGSGVSFIDRPDIVTALIAATLLMTGVICLGLFGASYFLTRANPRRQQELMDQAGLTPVDEDPGYGGEFSQAQPPGM